MMQLFRAPPSRSVFIPTSIQHSSSYLNLFAHSVSCSHVFDLANFITLQHNAKIPETELQLKSFRNPTWYGIWEGVCLFVRFLLSGQWKHHRLMVEFNMCSYICLSLSKFCSSFSLRIVLMKQMLWFFSSLLHCRGNVCLLRQCLRLFQQLQLPKNC